eukprot:583309-Rhodomonas_salina.1
MAAVRCLEGARTYLMHPAWRFRAVCISVVAKRILRLVRVSFQTSSGVPETSRRGVLKGAMAVEAGFVTYGPEGSGGGPYAEFSDNITISDGVHFIENTAWNNGGGCYASSSLGMVVSDGVHFGGNEAGNLGGGLYAQSTHGL